MSFLSRNRNPAMSVQKRQMSLQRNQSLSKHRQQPSSLQSGQNVVQQKYTVILQNQDSKSSDPTVTGVFTIVKDPTWKKVFLDIRSFSTMVLGTIDGGLPAGIALKTVQMTGSLNLDQSASKAIAVAKPVNVSGHVVAADISAYSCCYELKDVQCLWDVTDLTTLNFFITVAGSNVAVLPPYANECLVEFAILGLK